MDLETEHPPLRRQAAWVVVCRMVGILAMVAGNILAVRLLGPAEFGRYLFLSSVAIAGSMLGAGGLADAVLRFTGENLALGQRATAVAYVRRTARLAIVTTLFSVCATAVGLAILHLTTGKIQQPALLIVLTVLTLSALAWQQVSSETLRGWNNLKLASLFSGGIMGGPISTLLFLAAIVGLSLANVPLNAAGAMAIFAASVVLTVPFAVWSVLRTIHADAKYAHEPIVILTPLEKHRMLAMAGTMLALGLLGFVSEQLDIWIGRVALAPDELGVYGVAKRCLLLVAMPVQIAMLATVGAIPRFYAQGRRSELQDLLRGATTLAAVPSLAAMAGLVFFPGVALSFLFGDAYDGAAPMIRILAVGYTVLVLVGTPINMLTLTGRHRTALLINLVSAGLIVLVGPMAAYKFGVIGLAWTTTTALVVQCSLQWSLARRLSGVWTHAGLPHRHLLIELSIVRKLLERKRPTSPQLAVVASPGLSVAGIDSEDYPLVNEFSPSDDGFTIAGPPATCTRCGEITGHSKLI